AIYVDDLLIIDPSMERINAVKDMMKREFQMTDLGKCHQYLGMNIEHNNRHIKLHQKSFITSCINKFKLTAIKKTGLPHTPGQKLGREQTLIADTAFKQEYQSQVGSLIYLAT